ncbi:MAG: 50S ribosomal protein L29 [Candidatus Yonathbacteria bacterium]|nr:50S ribosomal protein L29 [Candidatus Yonathbacteria bacterium]
MTDFDKKSVEEITKLINEKREGLRADRFKVAGSAKKGMMPIRLVRKEIARALTSLNARKNKSE